MSPGGSEGPVTCVAGGEKPLLGRGASCAGWRRSDLREQRLCRFASSGEPVVFAQLSMI